MQVAAWAVSAVVQSVTAFCSIASTATRACIAQAEAQAQAQAPAQVQVQVHVQVHVQVQVQVQVETRTPACWCFTTRLPPVLRTR